MRCVVTAGPTYEPIDQVRRLTNHSTGKLGSNLAKRLVADGHEVILLRGIMATHKDPIQKLDMRTFTTTDDLAKKILKIAEENPKTEAIFHAAAVSDYYVKSASLKNSDGELISQKQDKLSTRDGKILLELHPTKKIIAQLREWFKEAQIFGWKYEVKGDRATSINQAKKQIDENKTNACIINGSGYGDGFGLLKKGSKNTEHLDNSEMLFNALAQLIKDN